MAAPTISAQVANSDGGASVTDPWTLGSLNVSAGDELWVIVATRVRTVVGVTQDPGGAANALTKVFEDAEAGTAHVYAYRLAAPDTGSLLDIAVDLDGTGEMIGAVAYSVSGVTSVGTSDSASGIGTSASLTLDGSDVLNLAAIVKFGGGSSNPFNPGTMTEDLDANPLGTARVGVFHESNNSTPSVSWTTSDSYVFGGISLSGATVTTALPQVNAMMLS